MTLVKYSGEFYRINSILKKSLNQFSVHYRDSLLGYFHQTTVIKIPQTAHHQQKNAFLSMSSLKINMSFCIFTARQRSFQQSFQSSLSVNICRLADGWHSTGMRSCYCITEVITSLRQWWKNWTWKNGSETSNWNKKYKQCQGSSSGRLHRSFPSL